LATSYGLRPGSRTGQFSKEKISKGEGKEGKREEKRISGEANDSAKINKRIKGALLPGACMGQSGPTCSDSERTVKQELIAV